MNYHFSKRLNELPSDALSEERRDVIVQMIDAFISTGNEYMAGQINMQLKNAELYGPRSEVIAEVNKQDWSWQNKTGYTPKGYRHRMYD